MLIYVTGTPCAIREEQSNQLNKKAWWPDNEHVDELIFTLRKELAYRVSKLPTGFLDSYI